MSKKIFIALFLFIFAISGCSYEVFNRKFVRKKKKQTGPPEIYQIQPFIKPPNIETYRHAFVFWKTWENELLIALSPSGSPRVVNNLKVKECLRQAMSNLDQMKSYLNQAKSQELDAYLKELQQFNTLLEEQDLSDMALFRMRHDIEAHKRNVDIRFCPSNIKSNIIPDEPALAENIDAAVNSGGK
jgi:hypothetical protein